MNIMSLMRQAHTHETWKHTSWPTKDKEVVKQSGTVGELKILKLISVTGM